MGWCVMSNIFCTGFIAEDKGSLYDLPVAGLISGGSCWISSSSALLYVGHSIEDPSV